MIVEEARIGHALGGIGCERLGRFKVLPRNFFGRIGQKVGAAFGVAQVVVVMVPRDVQSAILWADAQDGVAMTITWIEGKVITRKAKCLQLLGTQISAGQDEGLIRGPVDGVLMVTKANHFVLVKGGAIKVGPNVFINGDQVIGFHELSLFHWVNFIRKRHDRENRASV